ncbi:hypothetical protein [Streptomyces sp. NPDC001970]
MTAVKAAEVAEPVTHHATFIAAPGQLLGVPDGWVHARGAAGTVVAWTHARTLRRERVTIPSYEFGCFIGATCADGTVGKYYVSRVVNDEGFASRTRPALRLRPGCPARLEPATRVTRPSGHLQRDVPGFGVGAVSSHPADALRQYMAAMRIRS